MFNCKKKEIMIFYNFAMLNLYIQNKQFNK